MTQPTIVPVESCGITPNSYRIEDDRLCVDFTCPRCSKFQTAKFTPREVMGSKLFFCLNPACGYDRSWGEIIGLEAGLVIIDERKTRLQVARFRQGDMCILFRHDGFDHEVSLTVEQLFAGTIVSIAGQVVARLAGLEWYEGWHYYSRDLYPLSQRPTDEVA